MKFHPEEELLLLLKMIQATTTTTTTSSGNTACLLPNDASPPPPPPDVDYIYHLCQKANWDEAKSKKLPYFPPTFMADGKFTRASVELDDIVDVANEYYKSSDGDWIVLELDCKVLYYVLGIPTLAQRAPESTKDQPVKCLQIFGGISTLNDDLVSNIFPVKRSSKDGTFLKVLEPISFDSSNNSNNQEQEQKQSKLKDVSNASTTTTDPSKTKKTIKKKRDVGLERPLDQKATSRSASSKPEQTSNKRKGFLGRLRGGKN
mmetsp:Transcript_41686/g.99991  ORF Transcript_41686/g.99991 Transcript_41686/m.99991 type:complete len:261 (-) Transcript_41686:135-917(-)